jgi:hypothetical protein
VVASWSDDEVARRWLRLFPVRREKDGSAAEPEEADIAAIVNQSDVLAERRRRLSDISWWMRCRTEHIARRANREDRCTLVKDFGRTFKRVAGTSEHLSAEASRRGQRWVQAPGNPLTVAS